MTQPTPVWIECDGDYKQISMKGPRGTDVERRRGNNLRMVQQSPSSPDFRPCAGVQLEAGPGGLARVRIDTDHSRAALVTQGAQVIHFEPRGDHPLLFLSTKSRFETGKAVRGGVPICFPWFGSHPTDASLPAHGPARVSPWKLESSENAGGSVRIRLSADFPPFHAEYQVEVSRKLKLGLRVRNESAEPARFECALHSYFAVSDVREVALKGLCGLRFLDKVPQSQGVVEADDELRLVGETDRIYADPGPTVEIRDPGLRRVIRVTKTGSTSTVLWNPWIEKARALPDLGDEEWQRFVCVETGAIGDGGITLQPGEAHVLTATIETRPLSLE